MTEETIRTFARAATGIEGFDSLVGGGLPVGRITLLSGGPGTGKTVFGLQAVCRAAAAGTPGILVAFEESRREVVENHLAFDWGIDRLVADGKLSVMEARVGDDFVQAGQFDISGLLASVVARIGETGARWVMLDGLDALLGALENQPATLRELYRLKSWVAQAGVTCLLTAKDRNIDDDGNIGPGFAPFVADCVIGLSHRKRNGVFVRRLRVVKYRGGPGGAAPVPFVIGDSGIMAASRQNTRLEHEVSTERVGSGVARLDTLLGGGYIRGSSILISGAPGTAKTTLSASLAHRACQDGEKVLFISFDEAAGQIVRNMRSVGMDLEPFRKSGLLEVYGYRASGVSAESHYIEIKSLLDGHRPGHLIVDPISALAKAGGREIAGDIAERLLDLAKARGITTLMTTLMEDMAGTEEETQSHVSTIADTWINLSYNVVNGERNRALTIVKARGTPHSNQVRELKLQSTGIFLTDVYTAGGEVLMGTARVEREAGERLTALRREAEFDLQEQHIRSEVRDAEERIKTLQRALESHSRELELLQLNRAQLKRSRSQRDRQVRHSRHADPDTGKEEEK